MTPPRADSFRYPEHESGTAIEDSIARVIAGWREARPELEVEPIAITARLARIQAVLSPRLEGIFTRYGLRGADFAVIATLARLSGERVSQGRLASELGLSAGTVSLRIDRLVQEGVAQRRADPDDRRGSLVALTDLGRELFDACAPQHLANADELLSGLTERERAQLGQLLGKLLYTLEGAEPDDGVAQALGLVVDGAPVALEHRRAVGLPPLAGLLVRHVEPASPAAASGIRPGDLLRAADRRPLRTSHDLLLALSQSRRRREGLSLDIIRGAERIRVQVRLAPPQARSGSRSAG